MSCLSLTVAETLNRRWWGVRDQQADTQQANMAFFPQEVRCVTLCGWLGIERKRQSRVHCVHFELMEGLSVCV